MPESGPGLSACCRVVERVIRSRLKSEPLQTTRTPPSRSAAAVRSPQSALSSSARHLVSEAAVPAAGLVQTGRISFDSTGAANTGVAILNPNGVPVRLSYTMNRPDGSQFFQGSTDLAPGQQLSRFLNEFPYWGGSPDIQGTFSFTASSPVSVRRFVCTWRRTTRFELVLRLRIRERQSRRSPMN